MGESRVRYTRIINEVFKPVLEPLGYKKRKIGFLKYDKEKQLIKGFNVKAVLGVQFELFGDVFSVVAMDPSVDLYEADIDKYYGFGRYRLADFFNDEPQRFWYRYLDNEELRAARYTEELFRKHMQIAVIWLNDTLLSCIERVEDPVKCYLFNKNMYYASACYSDCTPRLIGQKHDPVTENYADYYKQYASVQRTFFGVACVVANERLLWEALNAREYGEALMYAIGCRNRRVAKWWYEEELKEVNTFTRVLSLNTWEEELSYRKQHPEIEEQEEAIREKYSRDSYIPSAAEINTCEDESIHFYSTIIDLLERKDYATIEAIVEERKARNIEVCEKYFGK